MSNISIIISCEHGGNEVPKPYLPIFSDAKEILETHRGYDIGILPFAKKIASSLGAPLFFSTNTRLLIDLNRSVRGRTLYSEFTKFLPEKEKEKILESYYWPYRHQLEDAIEALLSKKKRVLHLSIHSFTPELNGRVRNADIGLLFDPTRQQERAFCNILQMHLQAESTLQVRLNYPYLGTADALTTEFRRQYLDDSYFGIEIEINQKWVEDKKCFQSIVKAPFLKALHETISKDIENG